jgi:hypothetical protein
MWPTQRRAEYEYSEYDEYSYEHTYVYVLEYTVYHTRAYLWRGWWASSATTGLAWDLLLLFFLWTMI